MIAMEGHVERGVRGEGKQVEGGGNESAKTRKGILPSVDAHVDSEGTTLSSE